MISTELVGVKANLQSLLVTKTAIGKTSWEH